jgi:hypothetical protein
VPRLSTTSVALGIARELAVKKILLILALLAFVPATGSATELVVNGGFETGDLTGWDSTGNVRVLGEAWGISAYEGDYMAVLSLFGFADAGIGQDVDLTGYTSATVSFVYNLGALDFFPGDAGIDSLQVYLGGNLIFKRTINDHYGDGTTVTGWTPVSIVVPTAWLGGSMRFIFWNENVGEGDELQNTVAFIDSVSVNASVPDLSSTLLLLGMGLSGLVGAARLRLRK